MRYTVTFYAVRVFRGLTVEAVIRRACAAIYCLLLFFSSHTQPTRRTNMTCCTGELDSMKRWVIFVLPLILSLWPAHQLRADTLFPETVPPVGAPAESVTNNAGPVFDDQLQAKRQEHYIISSHHWLPCVAGVALLVATDETTQHALTSLFANNYSLKISRAASSMATPAGYVGMPLMLYTLGGSREKETARLMADALVNSGLITQVLKVSIGRKRPNESGDESSITGPSLRYESFPSGHTSAAFAMATVLAGRYPKKKWAFYLLATAVGASRIIQNSHFLSDVVVGAGIGAWSGNRALQGKSTLLGFKF